MKIDSLVPPLISAPRRKKEPKGSFKVSLSSTTETEESKQVFETSITQAPTALMDLQELIETHVTSQEKIQHGTRLMAGLQNLQIDLLENKVTQETLEKLEDEFSRVHICDKDPLSQIIKEIRQRVAIELAKQHNSI